jgi:hypothetical protein
LQCSSELVIPGPPYAEHLVVPRRMEPQMDLAKRNNILSGQEITLLGIGAVEAERVELPDRVATISETLRAATSRVEPCRDYVPDAARPFTLNAHQVGPEIQDQVVAFVIKRTSNTETELECTRRELRLGECALLIRRQHGQHRAHSTGRIVAAKGNVSV